MLITLLDNFGAIGVEDGDSVNSRLQHLEGDEVPGLDVVAHCKWFPSIVNHSRPMMVDDGGHPVAASVRLENDLFRDGS